MHLKFLARGTGSAAAAAAYLLAKRDAAGTERAAVEVLRGDPLEVARVADGLPFKYLYTSGVLAWSLEDAPTRAEIERVLDEFEETAWAGLDRDRYIWSAVLHRDHAGGVHVHIFAARCDLATGRSLNVAPPGWQKTFDPLRDAFNYEHGWSRPDDPARARPYRPSPHLAYLDAETLRAGWEVEPDRRALIGEHLLGRVTDGAVKDRAGVVAALEGLGFEVPRQGRHYVTILRPETGERLRLKGGLYEADFDRERFIRQVREPSGDRERADRGDDAKRAADAWRDLEEKRRKRADYHRSRYGGGGQARAGGARDAAGDVERERGAAAGAVEREAVPESLAGHLRRELGDEAVVAAGDSVAERRQELEAIRGAAAGDATACLTVLARVSVADDRDRAGADSGLARVVGAVRAGAEAAGRADRGLAGAGRVLAAAGRTARGCGDALDRAVRDAGPDLAELMGQKQAQRARAVSGREQAVGATSKGLEGLDEARQELLAGAVRRPTVAERERIVEAAEGRIEADLARRKEALGATSAGAALLREEYGDGGVAADARLQSFAEREAVLDQIEERVDEELEAQEGALRSIPLGKQYLWEAEQARPGGVEGSPPLAERESIVNTATERVEEEFDRREKKLAANAGNENLLVEVAGDLELDGGTLTLGERWRVLEAAARRLEEERAELEGKEAALLQDPAGAEFLRNAQLEMLGAADREANTLADRGRVIMAAEAALQKVAAKRQADQEWEKKKAAREQALARRPGGADLYHAHLADLDPQWGVNGNTTTTRENIDSALTAAESDGARQERLRGVLSDEAAATRYRDELGRAAVQFKPADLDRALSAAEQERAEQETRRGKVEALGRLPGGTDLLYAYLAARDPARSLRENIEAALGAAESDAARLERLHIVLSDEAAAIRYRDELGRAAGPFKPADLDRALSAAELDREERQRQTAAAQRVFRVERLFIAPRAGEAFIAALDEQDPSSRTRTHPMNIDRALDIAERELGRETRVLRHARVLNAEQQFPGASSATWRAGDDFTGAADTDRHLQQVIDLLQTAVEHQQLEAVRARTNADRLDQRNGNSLRPVVEKSPPAPKPARLVPAATWEDAQPLVRALTDLDNATDRSRLDQRARHAVRPVSEKTPPVPGPARLVPAATREDAVAAAPLIVRARLPEAEQQELRLGVDIAARELASEFGSCQWWSHAGGELEELHSHEDRYLALNDTTKDPVEIGMLRTVLEKNVYEEAFRLVEHPAAAADPPANLFELVRAFIRRLQDAVDRLIDRVLDRKPEPAEPAVAKVSAAEEPSRLTFAESYSRHWPEHADDIHHPDFEELAVGAASRNKLFERQRRYSSKWTTIEPEELPLSLAKAAPAWDEDEVKRVTWLVTPGVGDPERTLQRQIVDAHLDDYEHRLPAQYAHSAEWRAIRELAEEAIRKLQHSWWYKRADRKGKRDDRKKRKLEAAAINRECGRDARRLHKEMMAARAAARPDWEVTVRIRAVQDAIRDERIKLEQERRAQERPVSRQPERRPERRPTRDHNQSPNR